MTDEISPRRQELRVSHEDRDKVAERLRVAAGDGRLTMEELDQRLEKALSARTEGELMALVTDLPAAGGAQPEPKDLVRIEVGSSSTHRDGRWVLPRALEVKAASGSVRLDLTEAVVTHPRLRIDVDIKSGSLLIITRPGIEVDADEVVVKSGSVKVRTPETAKTQGAAPDTFLRIEVTGTVKSGSLVARPRRRGFWAWLLRRPQVYGPS